MTSNVVKTIVIPICIHAQGLKLICWTALELSKEKCIFMYSMTSVTLTFDLMPPKFVGNILLPMCIHDQVCNLTCQTVLELSKEKCVFMYSMTSVTFDLGPQCPKICVNHCAAHVHTWPRFQVDMSNRSWIIKGKVYFYVFYDLCDLWPWTSTLQNLISSLSLLYAYMTKVSTSYLYRF